MTIFLLLFAGFICGLINSVAGGGALLAIALLLALGLSPLEANITTYIIIFPGCLTAVYGYKKELQKMPKPYFFLILPVITGSIIGVIALSKTSHDTFNAIIPWLILTAVLLFAFQPQLHKHLHRPPHMRPGTPILLVIFGLFIAAIYGGYFGAGFGFIMLALLSFTQIKNIYQMAGLKNLAAASIGIIGTVYFSLASDINIAWKYGLFMATGCLIGGYIGARFAHRISPHIVRAIISVVGIGIAGATFIKF